MYSKYGMFRGGAVLGLILIVIIAYFLIKYFDEEKNISNIFRNKDNSINILNERFAKGEINEEEYIKIKKVLKD